MKLTKKILCTCLIVITVFSFMMQNLVFADEEKQLNDTDSADIGGILMKPVFALVNTVADAALKILTNVMMGDQKPVYGNTYEEYRPNTSSFLTVA